MHWTYDEVQNLPMHVYNELLKLLTEEHKDS